MGNIFDPLKARPTIYKGIEMRSRTEAYWAERWDNQGTKWEYEPYCFADENGQYLPDFRITEKRPYGFHVSYVDTKGVVVDPAPIQRKMEIIWSSQPEVTLIIIEKYGQRTWMGTLRAGKSEWLSFGNSLGSEVA